MQIALKAQREEPKREEVQDLLLQAENAVRDFNRPGAIAKLRQALAVGQGNALVHMRLGILLRDNGDLQSAVDQFTAAIQLQENYSDAWREKGIQEGRLTKNKVGEEALRKAVAFNPQDFDALASLAGILRKTDRLAEATEMYQRSSDVSNGHPYPLLMALKLRAKTAGTLTIDNALRKQLSNAGKMRQLQATANPPIDSPGACSTSRRFDSTAATRPDS